MPSIQSDAYSSNTVNPVLNHIRADATNHLPKVQTALLVTTTALAALSLIPPFRLASSIALRSVAALSAATICTNNWSDDSALGKANKLIKTAIVIMGLAGLALKIPTLIVVSILADFSLQLAEIIKCIKEKKANQALDHVLIATINLLFAMAIITGSWQIVVTAASISTLYFLFKAATLIYTKSLTNKEENKSFNKNDFLTLLSYLTLAATSLTTAINSAQFGHNITKLKDDNFTYSKINHTNATLVAYDKHGHIIGTAESGQTLHFEVKVQDCIYTPDLHGRPIIYFQYENHNSVPFQELPGPNHDPYSFPANWNSDNRPIQIGYGIQIDLTNQLPDSINRSVGIPFTFECLSNCPDNWIDTYVVDQQPLDPVHFPELALGGTALVTPDPKLN